MPGADIGQSDLDRLIAGLYDAATVPADGAWREWLSSVVRSFGGTSGLALLQDPETGAVDVLGAHAIGEHSLALYREYYHARDLWAQRGSNAPMTALLSADICTDEEFANSEIYVDFCKPHGGGQFYIVGAVLPVDAGIGVIGIHATRDADAFERRHAQALDRLLPHLQRALIVRSRLKEVEAERSAALAALDSLSHGVLLVDRESRVVYANRTAEAIAKANDGIAIAAKGTLTAARPAENGRLLGLIAGCALPAGGGALALPRPSGLRPLELIATPIGIRGRESLPKAAAAIVFLRDPEVQPPARHEALQELYDLTRAEARLAADLLGNHSLEKIAAARRLSRETLRTQLKGLFRKTGTTRQAELMRFLVAAAATGPRKPVD